MRRRLAALAAISALSVSLGAQAASGDPVGDLITSVVSGALPGTGGLRDRFRFTDPLPALVGGLGLRLYGPAGWVRPSRRGPRPRSRGL